jgi:sugar/nucleoside kinase (ribokinase family)
VTLGVHILDILGRPVTKIPSGQHSKIIDEIRITAAGTAAGTSVDLAKLGVNVQSFGAIGDDVLGDLVLTLMSHHGVDTRLLTRKAGERTSATILPIRPNGERPALHAPGANNYYSSSDLTKDHLDALCGAAIVHIGGADALISFPPAELAEHVADAKSNGAMVTIDLLRVGTPGELKRLAPLLANVNWFLPNAEQLCSLTGSPDLERGIDQLHAMGIGGIAVTKGANGCLIDDGHRQVELPALPTTVVDTTGCGDGFNAGFIVGLLLKASAVDAAWLGTACGGLVATGLGSDAGISSLEETFYELGQRPSYPDAIRAVAELRMLHKRYMSLSGGTIDTE